MTQAGNRFGWVDKLRNRLPFLIEGVEYCSNLSKGGTWGDRRALYNPKTGAVFWTHIATGLGLPRFAQALIGLVRREGVCFDLADDFG
jgi:hypothetical protein